MKTILLFDKDPVNALRVSDILKQTRDRVLHASTLEEVKRFVRDEKPDLVICHLPENSVNARESMMSTREKLNALATPLLCIMGHRNLPKAPEILGPKQYLGKPFTRNELLSAVEDHLKKGSRDRTPTLHSWHQEHKV